jgi:undecaprenyl-diphosphatase
MRGFIHRRDHNMMRRANNWPAPRWIRVYAIAATRLGDGWIWLAMGLVLLAFGGAERVEAIASAVMASAASVMLFNLLKRVTGRQRPCDIEPHCWATLLPPDRFSFPSGHTMTAFAVTVSVSLYYPGWSFGLLFCAFSIAVSRILLGMHFLSDVAAGALLGAALGWGSYFMFA